MITSTLPWALFSRFRVPPLPTATSASPQHPIPLLPARRPPPDSLQTLRPPIPTHFYAVQASGTQFTPLQPISSHFNPLPPKATQSSTYFYPVQPTLILSVIELLKRFPIAKIVVLFNVRRLKTSCSNWGSNANCHQNMLFTTTSSHNHTFGRRIYIWKTMTSLLYFVSMHPKHTSHACFCRAGKKNHLRHN